MTRDLQDIPADPSGICVIIEDQFEVLKGLVNCSGEIESGCLEPFKTTQYYKAHLLNVNTSYYSTQIQVLSFDKLSNYKQWLNSTNDALNPSALFICIDVNKNEDELKSFLDQLDDVEFDQIDTRSLLLFGTIPCSINNAEHPKTLLIQKFVERNYIETVKFQPNEEELEELEENREIHGIKRVWELLGIVNWATKILKKDIDNFNSIHIPTALASSLSSKCKAAKRPLVMESFCRQSQDLPKSNSIYAGMEPTAKDEECIYKFLLNAKSMVLDPEYKQQKVPPLSMKYLMEQRDRVQRGVRLSRDDSTYKYPTLASNEIKPVRLLSTEATLPLRECPQSLNTRMSIVNTNKQFQSDKETRAGSTSINVRSTVNQPVTTDLVSSTVTNNSSPIKIRSKNPIASHVPKFELQDAVIDDEDDMKKEIRAEIERKYDEINRGKPLSHRSLDEWVQNWSNVKDNPSNDNNVVYVATQLTKRSSNRRKNPTWLNILHLKFKRLPNRRKQKNKRQKRINEIEL